MINDFISERYDEIMLMSKKICRSHREWEEVGHFSIEKFMIHERAEELIRANRAMNFLSGIIHRSFHSSTSQYHTLIRQKNRMFGVDDMTQVDSEDSEYNYELDSILDVIQTIIEEMVVENRDQWFRATLFQQWLLNPNFSSMSRKNDIPRTSISTAVNEAIAYIQNELKNRGIDYEF
jgi:hypothetical protein